MHTHYPKKNTKVFEMCIIDWKGGRPGIFFYSLLFAMMKQVVAAAKNTATSILQLLSVKNYQKRKGKIQYGKLFLPKYIGSPLFL